MSLAVVPKIIRASAGTGKTFQLSNAYIALLLGGAAPHEILATTFTKKAAKEIGDRIAIRLASAASSEEARKELSRFVDPKLHNAITEENLLSLLRSFLLRRASARISTFDSLCIEIVRNFTLEVGVPVGWRILDSFEQSLLCEDAIGTLCLENRAEQLSELVQILSRGQSVRSVHVKLRENLYELYEQLRDIPLGAWTQYEVPVFNMQESLSELLAKLEHIEAPLTKKGQPNKNWEKAISSDREVLSSENWDRFISKGIGFAVASGSSTYSRQEIPPEITELYSALLVHAKSALLERLRHQTWATKELFDQFHASFEKRKRAAGGMSFSDVKIRLSDSNVHHRLEEIFYRLDGRFSHILLDEFQDTSAREWRVIQPLIEEILSSSEKSRLMFCVGDPKQAIYGWRGGVAAIFDEFLRYGPAIKQELLTVSYRSAPAIIETVNALFSQVEDLESAQDFRDAALRWKKNFSQHQSGKSEQQGFATVIACLPSPEEEKEGILFERAGALIEELLGQSPHISIGVLVRRNRGIARMMYELSKRGIDASEEGGNPLTDSPAVVILLSVFHLIDHPGDTRSAYHVFHSPLRHFFGDCSTLEELSLLVTRYHRSQLDLGVSRLAFLLAQELASVSDERDRRRLGQFVRLATQFESSSFSRLRDFVQFVREQKVEDVRKASVRVMTIHQSKGLEFDAVILPELESLFSRRPKPSFLVERGSTLSQPRMIVRAGTKFVRMLDPRLEQLAEVQAREQFEEELCVLYVAVTRAKFGLFLLVQERDKPRSLSHASLVCDALSKGDTSGKIYVLGESTCLRSLETSPPVEHPIELAKVQLDFSAPRRRFFPRSSPSASQENALLFSRTSLHQRLHGVAIHRCLESVEWLEDGLLSKEFYQELCADLSRDQGVIDDAVSRFLSLVKLSPLTHVLSRLKCEERHRTDTIRVEREFPIFLKVEDTIFSGAIDRLHLIYREDKVDSVELFDFKSGKQSKMVETKHRAQIAHYQSAVSRLFDVPIEAISTEIVYLTEDSNPKQIPSEPQQELF